MNILPVSQMSNQKQSFGMKFVKNYSFSNIVKYAEKEGLLQPLDNALNTLLHCGSGDVLVIDGKLPNGTVFSNFTLGNRTVTNQIAESPAMASYNGILELAKQGKRYMKLVGKNIANNLSSDYIISRYSNK